MNQSDVIWGLAKDNFEQARAHETYRANIATLVITLTGILAGSLSVDLGPQHHKFVYIAMMVLGFYGGLASAKHYERFRMHVKIAQHYLSLLKTTDVLQIDVNHEFKTVQQARKWDHSALASLSLNWLWTGFPIAVGVTGLGLLLWSS